MRDTSYVSLTIKHNGCWSELTNFTYADSLINVEYSSFGILKANRITMIRGRSDEGKSKLRYALDRDSSIINYDLWNVLTTNRYSVFIISMLQDADKAVISRLNSKGVLLINATIKDGLEYYDVLLNIPPKTFVNSLQKSDSRIEIINFTERDLNEKNLFKAISRNVGEMLLTDNERKVITRARELGYLNSPRKMRLDDVAKELGKSKMYVSLSMRSIFRKLSNLV
ncbi:bacterio-opsin activator [Sulfolobus sp. A20]|uniref:helix-turn-helix domain-containing protein n=1 Tax=Sulfolobaceae TaxID=118883 RepID=UPI00084600D7|nr:MULTISPECIES: helix-turn-helix domain-containing protein [unclassified Sulfolobus]TRM75699.1 bacterio-opsin activator [Sulfolobus sp. E5]TRM76375.1 bacterio-opsin activator [Sulfolobus sp. A20-N-F8]TRM83891.1 bacterio-opsin activator [Sulfolobus sp. A20-N-F6]TRM88007.1 bacterio-opsin activator [Sulfolobus sp. E3]TRM89486.1 bacterio-opsin activator [Sulfolobus sp. C3]TRM93288.1 bacterio-opsin activator [Sulfolobus sp. A20-N-G8]TRN00970.1 bacterio-opsin activator [Sulfolobus sp. E1]TRN0319